MWSKLILTILILISNIISKLDIFPLISLSDIVSINLVTLILENIGQSDVLLDSLQY